MGASILSAVTFANNKAKRLAIHLTKWTGKSRHYIHPKHLMPPEDYWYLQHIPEYGAILDVGCGTGAHSERIASPFRYVQGIDRVVPSVAGRNVYYQPVDLERTLPIFGQLFDVALCLDVLEHVHNRVQLLRNIRRALTADGVLLLSVPHIGTSWKRRLDRAGLSPYADPDHKIEYTLGMLKDELYNGGFRIVQRYPGVSDTPLKGVIDVLGGFSLTFYRWATKLRRRMAEQDPWEDCGFYVVCVRS